MTHLEKAINSLKACFPLIDNIKQLEEWDEKYTGHDAIFLGDAAEGGLIDDLPACDYYNEDYKEKIYIMGVHRKLRAKLHELGYYPECHDPGTWMAFKS